MHRGWYTEYGQYLYIDQSTDESSSRCHSGGGGAHNGLEDIVADEKKTFWLDITWEEEIGFDSE